MSGAVRVLHAEVLKALSLKPVWLFELEDIEDEKLFEKVANEFDSIMEDASEE